MFLVEALVVAVCLQQQGGCSESTSAYYEHNKDAQTIVKRTEEFGKKMVAGNEWLVYAASPMYSMVSGKIINMHIYKGFVLGLNPKQRLIQITWSY